MFHYAKIMSLIYEQKQHLKSTYDSTKTFCYFLNIFIFCVQMGNNNYVLESRMLIKQFLLAILWNVYSEMKITNKKGHMNKYGTTYHLVNKP